MYNRSAADTSDSGVREGELILVMVSAVDGLESKSNSALKVLVVDDDALNQRMMNLILSREGYQVSIASNGMEAVTITKSQEFDIILMDLQMPVMDGVSASRLIREQEREGKHTFIVALTASFLPEKGHELFIAGIDNYISKPFDLDHLRQILRYSSGDLGETKKVPVSTETGVAVLDTALGVQKVGGGEEIYKELLEDFIRELPERFEVLEASSSNGDFTKLSRSAHNLKGVSANLGMMRLSERAGKLEKLCELFDSEAIEHIIDEIRVIVNEIRVKASEYLSV